MAIVASAACAGTSLAKDEISEDIAPSYTNSVSTFTENVDVSFFVGYDTNYIFRGTDFGNDLYSFGVDLSGSSDLGFDWYAGVWRGSYNNDGLSGGSGPDEDETDIYGGISKDLGFVTVSAGILHFSFDSNSGDVNTENFIGSTDTTELVFGLSKSVGPIDLAFTWYEDIDAFDSTYIEFTVGHSRELSDKLTLNLEAGWSNYDDFAGANGDEAYSFTSVSAGIDYALNDNMTLSSYIAAEFTDGASGTNTPNTTDDEIYGGISLSFSL